MRVVILDSGVGGLSILGPLKQRWPRAAYSYLCDNGFFPYGTKTEPELETRVSGLLGMWLMSNGEPDVWVVACGTISTLVLGMMRGMVRSPVVGVVPAIKPAAAQSRSRIIGLLATPGTIQRQYTDALVTQFAPDCRVVRVGSDALVRAAEDKLRGNPVDRAVVSSEIAPLFVADGAIHTDVIVLGCTHFPLLQDDLVAAAPWPVTWLEPGEAIVRRVASLVERGEIANATKDEPSARWIFTKDEASVHRLHDPLVARGFKPEYGLAGMR